jgi:hypothetical protein
MVEERTEHRQSGWSMPPDQHAVPPTQRKIGEGAITDGPNGQGMTPQADVGPHVSRDPSPADGGAMPSLDVVDEDAGG